MKKIEERKKICSKWFKNLRNSICKELEGLEKSNKKFRRESWSRNSDGKKDLGGGEMSILRGKTFEKAGVNISTVFGDFSKNLKGKIPGTKKSSKFWASGISVVIHPLSPKIPAVHMNTRHIITGKSWFGGGMDITPTSLNSVESRKIAKFFHLKLEELCEENLKGSYKKYKKWCDDYFYLPHRQEPRGLGGIFYDYLNTENWEADFNFNKKVGETFLNSYKEIVSETIDKKWNHNDRRLQMHRRSRYTEFNLLYDRGTKFGLETNGNIDAILMSLPPLTGW